MVVNTRQKETNKNAYQVKLLRTNKKKITYVKCKQKQRGRKNTQNFIYILCRLLTYSILSFDIFTSQTVVKLHQ